MLYSREDHHCKEKQLNKNSTSLPVLRITRSTEPLIVHTLTLPTGTHEPHAMTERKPRRRWTVASLYQEYVTIPTKSAHQRSQLITSSPPLTFESQKSRLSSSHLELGQQLSFVPVNVPRTLLSCEEEDDTPTQSTFHLTVHRPLSDGGVFRDAGRGVATGTPSAEANASTFCSTSSSKGVDRPNRKMTATTTTSSCPPSYHVPLDEKRVRLRRKVGISQLRMSAPASPSTAAVYDSPRRPMSHPAHTSSASVLSTASSIPITHLQSHHRGQSSNNIPHIGHHTRPYYSTILRRESARPSTSLGFQSRSVSDQSSRPVSTSSTYFDRETSSFALPTTAYSPGEFGYIPPSKKHNSGFSMSGETELRMALADDDVGSYKYKDMRKGGVRGHVKRIGKEIRDKLSLFRR